MLLQRLQDEQLKLEIELMRLKKHANLYKHTIRNREQRLKSVKQQIEELNGNKD